MPLVMIMAACVLVVLLSAAPANAQEWKLVWSEEFDGEGMPDPEKWDYEEGFVRNQEAQYYTRARPENVRVEGGCLVIEGRKEQIENPRYDPGSARWPASQPVAEYTAGSINTRGKASWLYGRVEVSAKLPRGTGVWPAIWMLGDNISQVGWPKCGEIDIMEYVGKEPDHIYGHCHWRGQEKDHEALGQKHVTPRPYEDFHVYAVEWFPDRIDFFFDDVKYFTYPTDKATAPDGYNPFQKPHYLLLNFAIGGGWGGPVIDESVFPQKYLIDYVRIYQQPGGSP